MTVRTIRVTVAEFDGERECEGGQFIINLPPEGSIRFPGVIRGERDSRTTVAAMLRRCKDQVAAEAIKDPATYENYESQIR